jgi:hypothetical protein
VERGVGILVVSSNLIYNSHFRLARIDQQLARQACGMGVGWAGTVAAISSGVKTIRRAARRGK